MRSLAFLSLCLAGLGHARPAPQDTSTQCDNDSMAMKRVFFSSIGYIGSASFDPASGQFEVKSNTTLDTVPSWMVFNGPFIYAPHEFNIEMQVFKVDEATSAVERVQFINGSVGVVHLEFSQDKKTLFGAAFGAGGVDVWDINEEGMLENLRFLPSTEAVGPNTTRQDASHVHQVVLDPSGMFVAAADLGTDSILVVGKNEGGDYEILSSVRSTMPGCGPRHGAFFPVGAPVATHYFVVCELLNMVEMFTVEYTEQGMMLKQTNYAISTYAESGEFARTGGGGAAEIAISKDSLSLYASNRMTGQDMDHIVHFQIEGMIATPQDNGDVVMEVSNITLNQVDFTFTGGTFPRHFSFSQDGSLIFVGNQGGPNGLLAFTRDLETGSLTQGDGSLSNLVLNPAQNLGGPQFAMEF